MNADALLHPLPEGITLRERRSIPPGARSSKVSGRQFRSRDALIKVAVIDDHAFVREGVRAVLGSTSDIKVIGDANDTDGALRLCASARPDVLLIDVAIPGPGVLETLHRVRASYPEIRVLVYSVNHEYRFASRVLRAGANGYMNKGPKELETAVRHVHAGRKYITPAVAQELACELTTDEGRPADEVLSNREYEVLLKLGIGTNVKTIAKLLSLSPKTVRTYRSRILEKMQLKSTAELIFYVIHNDLILADRPVGHQRRSRASGSGARH